MSSNASETGGSKESEAPAATRVFLIEYPFLHFVYQFYSCVNSSWILMGPENLTEVNGPGRKAQARGLFLIEVAYLSFFGTEVELVWQSTTL